MSKKYEKHDYIAVWNYGPLEIGTQVLRHPET